MTSSTSMATRLAAAVIIVSLISLIVATWVGLATGRDLGEDLFVDRLDSLQATSGQDTATLMRSLDQSTEAAADSPQAAIAIESFTDGFDALAAELGDDLTPYADEVDALFEDYETRYVEPLEDTGRSVSFRDISAETPAGMRLQSTYSLPEQDVPPEAIDDAGDGTEWSEVHDVVHPIYRDMVERLDLVDLFLIEPDRQTVVYSVKKNPDLGTSLVTGPYSGTGLALSVERVLDDPEGGTVTGDLSFYPTSLVPLGAIVSPVFDSDGDLAGALAVTYDSTPLTSILTADGEWDVAGYPETSDTYLAGSDGTTRSEPREFIEDPATFLDAAIVAGHLTEEERAVIEARGTTVLTLRTDDSTITAARDGDDAIAERQSISGNEVFSTIGALDEVGPDWWVVAEINVETAETDIDDFRELLIVGVAIFVGLLAFVAVWWANRIVRPVRQISDRLAEARAEDVERRFTTEVRPLDVPDRSPIEFHRLATSFESMARSLREQRAGVEAARDERLELLRRMLPPTVAQRFVDGQVQALEEVPQVTVGVIVVSGMGALVETGSAAESRELVDRLLAEIDELAIRDGTERVKLVGDAYFAACGHDRPYLDHAPRLVGFAVDARDAVREIAHRSGVSVGLDVTAGIHTGPVTVGMTGGTRLVYDVWGETVTIAHEIARRAESGQILVTDATRALLPDTIGVDPVDGGQLDVWAVEPATVEGPA